MDEMSANSHRMHDRASEEVQNLATRPKKKIDIIVRNMEATNRKLKAIEKKLEIKAYFPCKIVCSMFVLCRVMFIVYTAFRK